MDDVQTQILDALREALVRVPGQRVCQLLSNALYEAGRTEDHFYVTDAKLLAALESFAKEST